MTEPVTWLDRLRARDITLPVHLGIPGVASTTSLIRHAQACGIGQSISFLWKNGRNIRRLMGLSTPDKLLTDLAAYRKTPAQTQKPTHNNRNHHTGNLSNNR